MEEASPSHRNESTESSLETKFRQAADAHRRGQRDGLEEIYREMLRQYPDHFEALNSMGVLALQTGRAALAVELIGKALALNENAAGSLMNLGAAQRAIGRIDDAAASFGKAIALHPDHADAWFAHGMMLRNLNRLKEAVASLTQAAILRPGHAATHFNLAETLRSQNKPGDAIRHYDRAVALNPAYAEAWNSRGIALAAENRPEDAVASFDRAIQSRPDGVEIYNNRGLALAGLRRHDEAIADYDRALALRPDYAAAHWNKSLTCLVTGRMAEGWRSFEWRKRKAIPLGVSDRAEPFWSGDQPIAGKTLLLHAEQGLGDTLQFCRYAKLAEADGARVILEVQPPLRTLMRTLSPTIRIICPGEAPGPFDYHTPMLSLPLAFQTTLTTIPADVPYLRADPAAAALWRNRLAHVTDLRVGLVWAGGTRTGDPELIEVDRRRSMTLAQLAPLSEVEGIAFVSLQVGEPATDSIRLLDFTRDLETFADTAALVENLDLVISVDTSVAHLAGVMGKPVWLLNRHDTCWRWLLDRDDSPWYPTMRQFRQTTPGDWAAVVHRVAVALRDVASRGGAVV